MKCEKCNSKDATFHFKANINGQISEHHMCSECADESGLAETMNLPMHGFSHNPLNIFSGLGGFMPQTFPSAMFIQPMFMPLFPGSIPHSSLSVASEESETKIPGDAGEELKKKRAISALRHKMDSAIKNENFEQAALIRDEIAGIENA